MKETNLSGLFEKIFADGIKTKVQSVIQEEAEKASEKVKERIKGMADEIALSILSFYTVERIGQEIVIHVKKEI